MSNRVGGRRIGVAATDISPIHIPREGVAGAGAYGETITDGDRTFTILREPVGHRVVATVAKDVFDNWFTLELEGAKEEENKAFDKMIQAELRRLRAKRESTIMSVMERGYGYGIIVIGFQDEGETLEDPVKNPTRIRQIKAYGTPQITQVRLDKNEKLNDGTPNPHYALPEIYFISQKGYRRRLRVHHTRLIHVATRYEDPSKAQWQGQSVLDPIWDDIVVLRNIRWSMGQTMFRYASGFPVFTFNEATKQELQAWVDAGLFGDISNRNFFVQNEKQNVEFKGLQGRALDPMPYYVPPMEHISAGTGIPLAILRGAQAGALTGSEVNQMEYYSIVSDEQTAYESGLRKLIDLIRLFAVKKDKEATKKFGGEAKIKEAIMAVASSDIFIGMDAVELPKDVDLPEFKFNWKGGFELDEKKKQEIALLRAQELQIRGQWHTRNELRKMEDPSDEGLPGPEGDKIIGQPSIDFSKLGGSAYHVTVNPDGSSTVIERPNRRVKS